MALLIGEDWRKKLQDALDGIRTIHGRFPSDLALISAQQQLTYLIALADAIEEDETALSKINIGHLAVYQLADVVPPDLSELLCFISDKVRKHLAKSGASHR